MGRSEWTLTEDKYRKNCETALIQGTPSIPGITGIHDIQSTPGFLQIVKFD